MVEIVFLYICVNHSELDNATVERVYKHDKVALYLYQTLVKFQNVIGNKNEQAVTLKFEIEMSQLRNV